MKRAQKQYLGLIAAIVSLLSVCTSPYASETEADTSSHSPNLVWERSFEGEIVDIGVDEECFAGSGGNIDSCLKWVLLITGKHGSQRRRRRLWWLEGGAGLVEEPLPDTLPFRIVGSGKYILIQRDLRKQGSGVQYRLLDWDGRDVWQIAERSHGGLLVRPDASTVFVLPTGGMSYRRIPLYSVRFVDTKGSLLATYDSVECAGGPDYDIGEGFFALSHRIGNVAPRRLLFDRMGRLLWEDEIPHRGPSGLALVTDSGFALFQCPAAYGTKTKGKTFVYGHEGNLWDTLASSYGTWFTKTFGEMAFGGRDRFSCYDIRNRKTRFAIEGADENSFGIFDVDLEHELLAVVMREKLDVVLGAPRLGARPRTLRVYNFEGALLTEVLIESMPESRREASRHFFPPFRLLGNKLLVLDGKKLRLYDLGLD